MVQLSHLYNIKASVESENPLIKMFALLDRRTGKKTLVNLKDQINLCPEWLRVIYKIRVDAETL